MLYFKNNNNIIIDKITIFYDFLKLICDLKKSKNLEDYKRIFDTYNELIFKINNVFDKFKVSNEQAYAIKYLLASAFDEIKYLNNINNDYYLNHPNLLVRYCSESWGGEKIFYYSDSYLSNNDGFLYLEILFHILVLGFRGKYVNIEFENFVKYFQTIGNSIVNTNENHVFYYNLSIDKYKVPDFIRLIFIFLFVNLLFCFIMSILL